MMVVRYASADQFRNETNVGTEDYTDDQLEQMIEEATVAVDKRTGRTWQGVQTATNYLYDGNDSTELVLDHVDIGSVTAISIDDDLDGNFTTVTPSYVIVYSDEGRVVLDSNRYPSLEVTRFTKGHKNVKLTYTYGSALPTEQVRRLCIMMVQDMLNPTDLLSARIDKEVALLMVDRIDIDES